MTRVSALKSGFTAMAVLALLAVFSPTAQAVDRGGHLKCSKLVPGTTITVTFAWLEGGGEIVGTSKTFTCSDTTSLTNDQMVTQPANANGWSVSWGGPWHDQCSPGTCYSFDSDLFNPAHAPHVRSVLNAYSYGDAVFTLSHNPPK